MNKNLTGQPPLQPTDWTISIPTKIIDGLFMADHQISNDVDFFETNQVTHVINCAGKQLPNNRNVGPIQFLTFQWSENHIQNIADQNVISAVINFIEGCRRNHGCLLIHCYVSESRPFCLLACYLMIKFKWNLYKTLEFLNSRKQDIELEPAFFEQLTGFHQKLQEKGLIKSREWNITQNMAEEQIIITNTFLNSKKRKIVDQQQKRKNEKKINVSWKNDLVVQHIYSPSAIISSNQYLQSKKVSANPSRSDSVNSKDEKKKDQKQAKNNMVQEKPKNLTQMNVTKKWTDLREMWLREKQQQKQKQNQNSENFHPGSNGQHQGKQNSLIVKKDNQRLNDRLQEKLNLLKKYEQKQEYQTMGKKMKKNSELISSIKESSIEESMRAKQSEITSKINSEKTSKTLHNNWIINNQVIKENNTSQQNINNISKEKSNKSVIIVKPNHLGQTGDFPSRSSLRKGAGSEKKPEKDENQKSKFFKNEQILNSRGRCNSTKPQRKESTGVQNLVKNGSLKGKGKWKF